MSTTFISRVLAVFCVLGLAGLAIPADAAKKTDKSFAEHKVVLQISDNNPGKQALVLNVAGNLLRAYGTDAVEIEIVAFGPGLRLMFADNINKGRIRSLAHSGVRFSACNNTMRKITKKLGKEPKLNPQAVRVSAGVVQILKLTRKGYVLIKP